MRNYCTKCGAKLDEKTKLCPKCDTLYNETPVIKSGVVASVAVKPKNKSIFKLILIIVLIAAIIFGACFGAIYAFKSLNKNTAFSGGGTSILDKFEANIYDIPVSTKTNVLFTVNVNDSDINTSSLKVETSEGVAIGLMNDDGNDGDKVKNDGVYSCTVEVKSDKVGGVSYRAVCDEIISDTFVIGFYKNISNAEINAFDNIVKTVNKMEYFDDIVEYISESEIIESYNISGERITYVGKCGIIAVYEFVNDDSKGGGEYHVSAEREVDYKKANRNLNNASFDINPKLKKSDVLIVRPYRNSSFQYDDFLSAAQIVAGVTGGKVVNADNTHANIDLFKTFNNYKSILIDSHGKLRTTNDGDIPYIYTGQVFVKSIVKNPADWQAGRLIICGNTIAVGAGFFDKYYEDNSLENSLFFLGTCHSMHDDSIAKVLYKKGASVVFGFTDTVSPDYCNKALFESVVNSLVLSAYTSKEAVLEVGNIYGQTDPNNSKCEFRLYGDGDFYITDTGIKNSNDSNSSNSIDRDVVILIDTSDSIIGMPYNDIKSNISKLFSGILDSDSRIAIVSYNDRAITLSDYTVYKKVSYLVDKIEPGGDSNLYAGLKAAEGMLESSKASEKAIVVLSGSNPNKGRLGDKLISYTDELKEKEIDIYSIGYFKYAKKDRAEGQYILEDISTFGCHFEAKNAENLGDLFSAVANKINGEKSIYVKVTGSVDVSVSLEDEVISSNSNETEASFGSLELIYENSDESNTTKVFRLKDGLEYDFTFKTFKRGRINYTVAFPNENGDYTDIREFSGIKLDKSVSFKSTVNSSHTTLEIDSDNDGRFEERMVAGVGEKGHRSLNSVQMKIIAAGACAVLVSCVIIVVIILRKKRKNEKVS